MPTPDVRVDTYDEREMMFGAMYPLVAAYETPEAIAAVMPVTHVSPRRL